MGRPGSKMMEGLVGETGLQSANRDKAQAVCRDALT